MDVGNNYLVPRPANEPPIAAIDDAPLAEAVHRGVTCDRAAADAPWDDEKFGVRNEVMFDFRNYGID